MKLILMVVSMIGACAISLIGYPALFAGDGSPVAHNSIVTEVDPISSRKEGPLRIPYGRSIVQVAMTEAGESKTNSVSSVQVENGVLSIPCETDGLRTKAISPNGFAGNLEIREVCIPGSVTWIGQRAFAGCSNLCSVVMLRGDSDSPFHDAGVAYIHSEAFMDCTSLTNVLFSSNLNVISDWAFKGCRSLKEAPIPSDVIHVSGSSFDDCDSLKRGDLSLTTDAMLYAYRGCPSLEEVRVSSNNTMYADYDGAVYYKDLRAMLRVPPKIDIGTFNVRNGVKAICPFAFEDSQVVSVILPDSLVCIGEFAFSCCTNLVTVSIPKSVEEIGDHAFTGCSKLKEVIFMGNRLPKIGDGAFPQGVEFR